MRPTSSCLAASGLRALSAGGRAERAERSEEEVNVMVPSKNLPVYEKLAVVEHANVKNFKLSKDMG